MKQLLIIPIRLYQILSFRLKKSGFIKDTCVFYPTCSSYAIESIEKHGIFKGSIKTIRRVTRCHPWQTEHHDPV